MNDCVAQLYRLKRRGRYFTLFFVVLSMWLSLFVYLNKSEWIVAVTGQSIRAIRVTQCSPIIHVPNISDSSLYGRPVSELRTVMFHSVPKCGSRTLVWVFWDFVRQFRAPDPLYIEYMLQNNAKTNSKIAALKKIIYEQEIPAFIHGHYRYIDYPEDKKPVLASMLREPYSRYVSWYYFMRHGDADMNKTQLIANLGPAAAKPNETLDDCFRLNRHDCREPMYYELNIRLFCGYDPQCDQDPEYALRKAKENVDKFLVIGLMEEYEDTIKVMEKLMPSAFGGAVKTYRNMLANSAQSSKTFFKQNPSIEIEAYLKDKLKYDIELYNYVKKRFHKLKDQLGIGSAEGC